MTEALHGAVDEHLRRLLGRHGDHEERSRQLLTLAANYRAKLLTEAVWRHYGGRVAGGPFAGMRLLEAASEGCLLPKLLGCYEAPLAARLRDLAGIDTVLNIGCAEGYYAVGLARLLPHARVHAYDIDVKARALCARLAELNGVAGRVEIGERFTACDFARFAGRDCLVLCDIEGGELDLLDPALAPALAGFTLMVEQHDRPERPVSPVLAARFAASHDIETLSIRERDLALPPAFEGWREIDQLLAVWEMRGGPTPWAVFTPRPQTLAQLKQRLPLSLDEELLTALELAEAIWRLEPDENNWRQLWDIANRAGTDVAAAERFVAAAPEQSFRCLALGNALRRRHRGAAAEAEYRKALGGESDLDAIVLTRLAALLLTQGRLAEADGHFQRSAALHPGRASAMRCDPAFLAALPPLAAPPTELPEQPAGEGVVVFAACDGGYFERFASAMLHSVTRNLGTRCCFHLHVVNPPADLAERLEHFDGLLGRPGISWSAERLDPGADAKTRYACARFRLLPHLLRRFARPVLMLDADLIMLRPPTRWLEAMTGHDVGLVVTDLDGFEPWNWLWADVVFAQPTDGALAYFERVARYVEHFLARGEAPWFLDQIALAACWLAVPPRLLRLPRDVHRLELTFVDGVDAPPAESVLFWSAHASTVDPALTLGMPRYQDYLLPLTSSSAPAG